MSLTTNGLEHITYPDETKAAVAAAAMAWRDFTRLDVHEKDQFAATSHQMGVGYERKGGNSSITSKDTKENFDITRAGIDALRQQDNTAPIASLLATTAHLLDTLVPVADKFCGIVERTHGIPGFRQMAKQSAANRFIRFLHYPPVPEGTVIGEAHTDHSGYTFHLYESTGGCHGLAPDTRQWVDMPVESSEMAVFGGMQLQLVSNGRVRALCHEITANATTADEGRLAIVCFNLLDGVPTYDRVTHGRLQDRTPGFNYDMPPAEFAALFRR